MGESEGAGRNGEPEPVLISSRFLQHTSKDLRYPRLRITALGYREMTCLQPSKSDRSVLLKTRERFPGHTMKQNKNTIGSQDV